MKSMNGAALLYRTVTKLLLTAFCGTRVSDTETLPTQTSIHLVATYDMAWTLDHL